MCGSNVEAEGSAAAMNFGSDLLRDMLVRTSIFTKHVVAFAKPWSAHSVLLEVVRCATVLFSEMQSRELCAPRLFTGLDELGGSRTKLYVKRIIV